MRKLDTTTAHSDTINTIINSALFDVTITKSIRIERKKDRCLLVELSGVE